jgi:hypothetical protein
MSLWRLVYYSAVIGGWAAFAGWFVAEWLVPNPDDLRETVTVSALVGAAIGAGLNVVAGMSNAQWKWLLRRSLPGLGLGAVGGGLGGLLGQLMFAIVPRFVGFVILGLSVGIVDGLYERAGRKIRNGLIGGSIGGLVGGVLFDPIAHLVATGTGMTSRAAAFVILGLCVGLFVGLVQVVLKDAWLTVLDGYRPGRQLILSQAETILGRAEHLPLPFMGPLNETLDLEHARIMRKPDGTHVVEDISSGGGVSVNFQPVHGARVLRDGDVIKLGTNYVRFNERAASSADQQIQAVNKQPTQAIPPPPPAPKVSSPPTALAPPSVTTEPRAKPLLDDSASKPSPPTRPTPGGIPKPPSPPPPPPRRA